PPPEKGGGTDRVLGGCGGGNALPSSYFGITRLVRVMSFLGRWIAGTSRAMAMEGMGIAETGHDFRIMIATLQEGRLGDRRRGAAEKPDRSEHDRNDIHPAQDQCRPVAEPPVSSPISAAAGQ